MKGFFITGTDTGIGKTVCSAILLKKLRGQVSPCYWKPVQTGVETDDDTKTVKALANCSDGETFDAGFRLEKPLSPHLSARLAGVEITVEKILDFLPLDANKFWLIEGAGGVFVPLNECEMMIDLISKINLPVVVVARSALGTINHTLLTLEAIRNRNLKIAAVIMNGESNTQNRQAIEHFGKVKVFEIFRDESVELKSVFSDKALVPNFEELFL